MKYSINKKVIACLLIISVIFLIPAPTAWADSCDSNFFTGTLWNAFLEYFPTIVMAALVVAIVYVTGGLAGYWAAPIVETTGGTVGGAVGGAMLSGPELAAAAEAAINAPELIAATGATEGGIAAGTTAANAALSAGATAPAITEGALAAAQTFDLSVQTLMLSEGMTAAEAASLAEAAASIAGAAGAQLPMTAAVATALTAEGVAIATPSGLSAAELDTLQALAAHDSRVAAGLVDSELLAEVPSGALTFVEKSFETVFGTVTLETYNVVTIPLAEILAGTTGLAACASGLICVSGESASAPNIPVITVVAKNIGCNYTLPVKFYIPQLNVNYVKDSWNVYSYDFNTNDDNYNDASSGEYLVPRDQRYQDSSCTTQSNTGHYGKLNGFMGNSYFYNDCVGLTNSTVSTCAGTDPNFSEENREVAIYRFVLPTSATDNELQQWSSQTVPGNVGAGFTDIVSGEYYSRWTNVYGEPDECSIYGYSSTSGAVNDSAPYFIAPASTLVCSGAQCQKYCDGNVCTFNDPAVPNNSYVAYVAKVLGDYTSETKTLVSGQCEEGGENCSSDYYVSSCDVSGNNKFLGTENVSAISFLGGSYGINTGNAIFGPFKTDTAVCPAPPTPPACVPAWTPDSSTASAVCSTATFTQTQTNCPNSLATQVVSGTKDCSQKTLTITKSGAGTGNVQGTNYPNISCGSNCPSLSSLFDKDASVILKVTPDSGSTFFGWSGSACEPGTGGMDEICIAQMDADKTINAEFTRSQTPPGDFSWNPSNDGITSTCNQVMLSWTASAGADRYEVRKQTKSGGGYGPWQVIATKTSDATSHTDYNVVQNNDYKYQVKAYNDAGEREIAARTETTPYCSPTADLSVTQGFLSRIYQGQGTSLTWTSTYANSCSASASSLQSDWNGSMAVNGTKGVHPSPPPSVDYTITCTGLGPGSASDTIRIDIDALGLPGWREIIPR